MRSRGIELAKTRAPSTLETCPSPRELRRALGAADTPIRLLLLLARASSAFSPPTRHADPPAVALTAVDNATATFSVEVHGETWFSAGAPASVRSNGKLYVADGKGSATSLVPVGPPAVGTTSSVAVESPPAVSPHSASAVVRRPLTHGREAGGRQRSSCELLLAGSRDCGELRLCTVYWHTKGERVPEHS